MEQTNHAFMHDIDGPPQVTRSAQLPGPMLRASPFLAYLHSAFLEHNCPKVLNHLSTLIDRH